MSTLVAAPGPEKANLSDCSAHGLAAFIPPQPEPLDLYRVALVEEGQVEVLFSSPRVRDVLVWAKEWLRDPVAIAIAIFPPGVPAE